MTARLLVWLVIVAPWLALVPSGSPLVAVALSVITLVAAFHGTGLLLLRIARLDGVSAALLVHWGLAAMLGIAGVLMTVHAYGHAAQTILVFSGVGLHSGLMILDRDRYHARITAMFRDPQTRFWWVPALLLIAVAALHVLGAAGDVGARPFDDEANHFAQLRRLLDTGTLGDPIGFSRKSQLGGQVVVGAFANVLGDLRFLRVMDSGLGFALLLWLAVTRLRPRDATTGVWAVLLIFVAASYPFIAVDPSTRWLATSLILALHLTLRDLATSHEPHPLWPIGLLAGALATLRLELIPVAIAAVMGASILGRACADLRRLVALVGVLLAVIVPYVIVRLAAKGMVGADAYALVAPARPWILPLVASLAIIVVAVGLARYVRDPAARWIAITTVAGCAGIASKLTGAWPYATAFLWPILVAGILALGVEALRSTSPPRPTGAVLAIALVACALIYEGRDVPGRVRWVRRYADLIANIEYLRHAPSDRGLDHYGPLLASVPPGSTVVVWVTRPETLDYARHRIIDLRVPRLAGRAGAVLAATRPDYLLIEDPQSGAEPNELEALSRRHPTVANAPGLRVVDLAR